MAYDSEFYKAYEDYLLEPTVRKQHDWVFYLLGPDFRNVVDLGCGQSNEFRRFAIPLGSKYVGIDTNANSFQGNLVADYREPRTLWEVMYKRKPTAFVSLFSSEITAPACVNCLLYNDLFENFPKLQSGLVSGFYYADKKNVNPVKEAGEIISYQTLEGIEDVARLGYSEKRIILPVPSKLFGPHVVEVWKIFERL